MNKHVLSDTYRAYIDGLNRQDWPALSQLVDENVHYNGLRVGLSGYRAMLERDFRSIPDLRFVIDRLITDPPQMAARLCF
ncbi:ester cyclase, partial [Pseudomonas sp. TH31]|uniref:ester cyclase n=1 Tax=Pseudomonas sp. TH31 TaxID=2796396 RepID=UPI0019124FEE